jgi:energy-coupling factor transport system permease protein
MASAVRKAEEIALAMEARRFVPGRRRTRYREYGWGLRENSLVAGAAAILLAVLAF